MNESLLQLRDRIRDFWRSMGRTQKIAVISIIGIFLVAILVTTLVLSQTQYDLAFTDLSAQDADAILGYLTTNDIPYLMSADGKSIGVPADQAPQIRVAVESQGLLTNGSIGFGIFKESVGSFGIPDNQFEVLKTDALAGEIQQMLNAFEGISSSKVVLQVPEEDVFMHIEGDAELASASVILHIKSGYKLTQENIDAMFNTVSHAVQRLPIENISISDQYGEMLVYSKGDLSETGVGAASTQMQIRSNFEADLTKSIQRFLKTILGQRKVVVQVFSNLNFDQKQDNEEKYAPVVDSSGIARSVEDVAKSFSSTGGSSGVAGTGENDIPGFPAADTSGSSQSEETRRTVNYEINKITSQIVRSPYVVKSISINVGVEPPVATDMASLTQENIDKIQLMLVNIVRTALSDSGQELTEEEIAKQVVVFPQAFAGLPPEEEESYILYYLLGAVAVIFLSWLGMRQLRIRREVRREEERIQREMEEAAERARNIVPDMDSPGGFDSEIRKQLESLARKKPEEFVGLLRTWLIDD